jgi:hypothetical protein
METVPGNIKIGGALGLLGGVISIVCMVIFFKLEESTIAEMGAFMLLAVMFFALAGGLSKGGQWSWDVLLLMTFLTIGATLCATILGILFPVAAIVLMAIAALIVVILIQPASKTWVNRVRV